MKIKKGDQVKILIGKDKGRQGEVLVAFPKTNRILVKGLNLFKKHIKATRGQKGGIVEKERALLASKAIVVCPSCQKTTRTKILVTKNGDRQRICHHCQSPLNSSKK